jgi:peptide/nickel transport system substrate-binding protein
MGARAHPSIRLALALVLATGCVSSRREPDVVVFASGADLESANPLVTIHGLSRQVQRYVLFTTLARYDSTLSPVPYLAHSWEWSPDRKTLVFRVQSAVKWHDGRPTTAADIVFTLLAARDLRTGYSRAADFSAVDTVIARDDSTVVVEYEVPQPVLPLVYCELPILPAHLLEGVPHTEMRRAPFNLNPVGNGPFRFVERTPGQRWLFARNDSFPAALGGPPKINRLVIAVVDEATTKIAGLASGELDFAGIAPTMAELAKKDPTLLAMDYPILLTTGLVFNSHRPPFDDDRVRRAASLSLARRRIVDAALVGYGTPASGPVPPESPLALPGAPVENPALADSLLNAAGWRRAGNDTRTRGGKPLEVELLTVGSGDNAVEQLVQADLGAHGFRVVIRQLEMGAFLTRARGRPKQFDLLVTGIPGDLSLSFLGSMFDTRQRGSALDYADYHTPELDSLLGRARRATVEELPASWRAVQEALNRDMPIAWIYHSRGLQGVTRRLFGVTFDLRGELESVARWYVPESH